MLSDMIDSHTVTKCDPALYHSPNNSINSQFNIWSRGFCCEKEQCIVGKKGGSFYITSLCMCNIFQTSETRTVFV